jgi:hypothetical protein
MFVSGHLTEGRHSLGQVLITVKLIGPDSGSIYPVFEPGILVLSDKACGPFRAGLPV